MISIGYYKFVQVIFPNSIGLDGQVVLGSSQPLCVKLSVLCFNFQKQTICMTSLVDAYCLETVSGVLCIL